MPVDSHEQSRQMIEQSLIRTQTLRNLLDSSLKFKRNTWHKNNTNTQMPV